MSGETYQLIIRKGPKPGQIYPLSAPTITIGRDPMSDITLNDPEVSRYHAQLMETEDGYQIQDMGSTNGTYIAGQRIGGDPVTLAPGEEITFGSDVILSFNKEGDDSDNDLFMATIIDTEREMEEMAERPETAVHQMSSPPPLPSPNYNSEPAQSLVSDIEGGSKKKRTSTIVISIILILLLCCCGFIAFMWFYGGDWLAKELDLALVAPIAQFVMA